MNVHVMDVLDVTGHTEVRWNPADAAEVEAARTTFNALTGRGYRAFRSDDDGRKGERMDTFDPAARVLTLVPQVGGG
jgi:hypothetical protein